MNTFQRLLIRLHRDERGNLAVLLLLTLWVLVLLLALVWNSGEAAARRQQAQNSADAAAHAGVTWQSRTANQVAATNMLIVQNACAQVVWESYHGTMTSIDARLAREQRRLRELLDRVQQERAENPGDAVIQLRCDLLEQAIQTALQGIDEQIQRFLGWLAPVAPAMYARTGSEFVRERQAIHDYQMQIAGLTPDCADADRELAASAHLCNVAYGLPLSWDPHNEPRRVRAPVRTTQHTNIEPIHHSGTSVVQQYIDPRDGQQKQRNIHIRGGSWGAMACPPRARYYHSRISRDFGDIAVRGEDLRYVDEIRRMLGQMLRDMLTPPDDVSPDLRRAYTGARRRIDALRLDDPFAYDTWTRTAHYWRSHMLWRLGNEPQAVLATYHRRHIPDWARPGIYEQVYHLVYRDVLARNADKPSPQREEGAARIAQQVATRWVSRSWPYEITPPQEPAPPNPGLSRTDRLSHFTIVTGAYTSDTPTSPLLPNIFKDHDQPASAFAQAETFNWMEYHGSYGAGDRYYNIYPPLPWRVSTIGGWNWRPRLALTDSLHSSLHNNVQFRQNLHRGGLERHDSDSIHNLQMH